MDVVVLRLILRAVAMMAIILLELVNVKSLWQTLILNRLILLRGRIVREGTRTTPLRFLD